MKKRCLSQTNIGYRNYGGRGIKICDRWLNSYENFLADMGEPAEGMELDRIDHNGHYEPTNCRWATDREQSRNTRRNVRVEMNGRVQCLADWASELNMNYRLVKERINQLGWDPVKALTTPKRTHTWRNLPSPSSTATSSTAIPPAPT